MTVFRWSLSFAIGGLLLLSFPHSVRGDESQAIALTSGLSVLATGLCASAAIAEGRGEERADKSARNEYTRRGPLVGAALAYAVETFESDAESDLGDGANLSLKNSFGFKGRLGYRCHRYVSAEAQVEWLDSFDGTVFLDGAGKVLTRDFESVAVTANARAYLPLWNDRIQPFALFGAGLVTVKVKTRDSLGQGLSDNDRDTDVAIRGGGGVDFYVTPNIVVTFETDYLQAFGTADDLSYLSIGLGAQYRF